MPEILRKQSVVCADETILLCQPLYHVVSKKTNITHN